MEIKKRLMDGALIQYYQRTLDKLMFPLLFVVCCTCIIIFPFYLFLRYSTAMLLCCCDPNDAQTTWDSLFSMESYDDCLIDEWKNEWI